MARFFCFLLAIVLLPSVWGVSRAFLDVFLLIPSSTDALFSAAVEIVPLQLLAYYVAKENGCDIDKPKNLAKSVTVE